MVGRGRAPRARLLIVTFEIAQLGRGWGGGEQELGNVRQSGQLNRQSSSVHITHFLNEVLTQTHTYTNIHTYTHTHSHIQKGSPTDLANISFHKGSAAPHVQFEANYRFTQSVAHNS